MPNPQTESTNIHLDEVREHLQLIKKTWQSRKTAALGELLCRGHMLSDALKMVDFLSNDLEVAAEFEFYREIRAFVPEAAAIKRCDYTAEQLAKSTLLSSEAAYLIMSCLKQHPELKSSIMNVVTRLQNLNSYGIMYGDGLKSYLGCRLAFTTGDIICYRPTGDGRWCIMIAGDDRKNIVEQFFCTSEQEAVNLILRKTSPIVDSILFEWDPANIIFTTKGPKQLQIKVFHNANDLNNFLCYERSSNIYLLSLTHSTNRLRRVPACDRVRIIPHGQMFFEMPIPSQLPVLSESVWVNKFTSKTADKVAKCLIDAYFHSADYFVICRVADEPFTNALAKALADTIHEDMSFENWNTGVYDIMVKQLRVVYTRLQAYFMRYSDTKPMPYANIARKMCASYERVQHMIRLCEKDYLETYIDSLIFEAAPNQRIAKTLERIGAVVPAHTLPE